jgi:DNA-binding response OmpR family regulator
MYGKLKYKSAKSKVIKHGDLVIDLPKYEVHRAGRLIILTLKEYELLCLMASNPGRVFTRGTLLNKIWGYNYFGGARTVDVHITRLRNKIEAGGDSFIGTVRGVGYKFKELV